MEKHLQSHPVHIRQKDKEKQLKRRETSKDVIPNIGSRKEILDKTKQKIVCRKSEKEKSVIH